MQMTRFCMKFEHKIRQYFFEKFSTLFSPDFNKRFSRLVLKSYRVLEQKYFCFAMFPTPCSLCRVRDRNTRETSHRTTKRNKTKNFSFFFRIRVVAVVCFKLITHSVNTQILTTLTCSCSCSNSGWWCSSRSSKTHFEQKHTTRIPTEAMERTTNTRQIQ